MKYHSNIRKVYMYSLFHSLIFAYVIERLFWASRGMTVMFVVYSEIIYSGVTMLLELPTGMLADRFSRKTWIVLDSFLSLAEFVIIIFAHQFWHFAVAIGLSGVGNAFQSGAYNSLIYDSLKSTGDEKDFEKILGRLKAFDYTSTIIGGLVGAYIASRYPLVTTYWMSLFGLIAAIIVSFTLKEVVIEKEHSGRFTVRDWLEISRFIFTKKSVRFIAVVGMITGSVTGYFDEFWQIYLEAVKVPVAYFGIFEVIGFGAVALGSLMAYRQKDKMGLNSTLMVSILCAIISFFGMALIQRWYAIFLAGLLYYALSVIEPLIYGYLHDHAIPKYRATIESAYSFLAMLAVMVIGIPFGVLSTEISIYAGFIYLGALLVILEVVYVVIARRLET